MISNLFVIAVVFLSLISYPGIIQSSETFTPSIIDGLEELSDWDNNSNIKISEKSSSANSETKKNAEITSSKGKRLKEHLKYRSSTEPIKVDIDDAMANSLRNVELEMFKKWTPDKFTWQNHSSLTKDKIQPLCLKAWMSLKPTFQGTITNEMVPDCDGGLILEKSQGRKSFGLYQYVPELENLTFRADMLRCNCAYTKWFPNSRSLLAVGFSRQFFYMLKENDKTYYILTMIGELSSRKVKLVNVYTML